MSEQYSDESADKQSGNDGQNTNEDSLSPGYIIAFDNVYKLFFCVLIS